MKEHNEKEQIALNCKISVNARYSEPSYTMSIATRSAIINFGGKGDISVVTGKAKSRKTFLLCVLASSSIRYQRNKSVEPQICKNLIIYFDTEQSEYHAAKTLNRILSITGAEFENNIEYYALRGLSVPNRIEVINHILNSRKNISIVFIDGARDLVSSINDEYQATSIVEKFAEWSRNRDLHIVTVLHENSSTDKLRGHLGTELTNKAENVFVVEIDKESPKDTSKVYTRYSRNGDAIEFVFVVDEHGVPRIDFDNKTNLEFDSSVIIDRLKLCFEKNPLLGHSDLLNRFKSNLELAEIVKGNNALKQWITKYVEIGILVKEGAFRSPRAKYRLA